MRIDKNKTNDLESGFLKDNASENSYSYLLTQEQVAQLLQEKFQRAKMYYLIFSD